LTGQYAFGIESDVARLSALILSAKPVETRTARKTTELADSEGAIRCGLGVANRLSILQVLVRAAFAGQQRHLL